MKTNTNPKKIEEVLSRAIEKIYPSKKSLEKILKSGKRLKIYFGIDPTAPFVHLDHGTSLLILKRFQNLGHEVILLIGDFTARIGDPTGKISTRRQLSKKEVINNYRSYQEQAAKILDFNSKRNPVKIVFNSKWYEKMSLTELMNLMSKITIKKIVVRNMFREREKKGKEIYFNEFLYPLLQGYDSVKLDVDIELGGSDQIFNMLIGRDLMKIYKNKKKFVIAKEILEDPKTGKMLMSKSEGRYIALDEKPEEMYGKIMALPDEVVLSCFEHWTEIPLKEITRMKKDLQSKKVNYPALRGGVSLRASSFGGKKATETNPKDLKARLAQEIVTIYHNKKAAEQAEKEFNRVFKEKKAPLKIPEIKIKKKTLDILDLLVQTKLVSSRSEAKRLILQKGVKINSKVQQDWQETIKIKKKMLIQIGKRKFIKII